jgi:hypothetical protein
VLRRTLKRREKYQACRESNVSGGSSRVIAVDCPDLRPALDRKRIADAALR